jgi:iron(III) transport system ATP-binding protein
MPRENMDHIITEDRDVPAQRDRLRPEALAFDRVAHRYGAGVAVDDVSLSIAAGEIVCLCGPSGCGKSTLLRIAAGLETLQQGEVRLGGRTAARAGYSEPPERRGVGLVFQDYALFPHLNILDNVCFGLSKQAASDRKKRAMTALEQVGMAGYAAAYPHQLSGGQQQRAALARALAPDPAVLLLDEPFSGLDARLREQVRDETLQVLKRNGAATLLVTHDSEEAMFLADRIALMRSGKLVQSGAPLDLYTRPDSPYAATFFGEVNTLRVRVARGCVTTPLGTLPAVSRPDGRMIADGAEALVMIRPEGLRCGDEAADFLGPKGMPTLARVIAARPLGYASLLTLEVGDPYGGAPATLRARAPGRLLPPEGAVLPVALDSAQAFVFAE